MSIFNAWKRSIDAGFNGQVKIALVAFAAQKLSEHDGADRSKSLARRVLQEPEKYAPKFAVCIVSKKGIKELDAIGDLKATPPIEPVICPCTEIEIAITEWWDVLVEAL